MSKFMLSLGLAVASLVGASRGVEAASFTHPSGTAEMSPFANSRVFGPYPLFRAQEVQRFFADQGYQTRLVHGPEGYLVEVF